MLVDYSINEAKRFAIRKWSALKEMVLDRKVQTEKVAGEAASTSKILLIESWKFAKKKVMALGYYV